MFGEKYDEMRIATYKSSSVSPLLMASEFIIPSFHAKQNRINDFNFLSDFSEKNAWAKDIVLRRIMSPFTAVVITDINKKIIWVSGYFEVMTGYSSEEVLDQNPKLLQGDKTDIYAINSIRKKLKHKKGFKGALINYKKNGEAYACNVDILPVFDLQGNHVHYIAFETDK